MHLYYPDPRTLDGFQRGRQLHSEVDPKRIASSVERKYPQTHHSLEMAAWFRSDQSYTSERRDNSMLSGMTARTNGGNVRYDRDSGSSVLEAAGEETPEQEGGWL